MQRRLTHGICACLLGALAVIGCSSKNGSSVDTGPADTMRNDAAAGGIDAELAPSPDVGCGDDSAAGISCGIKNPPDNRGGGSIVTRQNPVPYQTCKAQ